MARASTCALVALAAFAMVFGPAAAHVTAQPRETTGHYSYFNFRIPHGCTNPDDPEGPRLHTTGMIWQIDDAILAVGGTIRPEVTPGWDAVVDYEAKTLTWTTSHEDHHLPDSHVLNLGVNLKLPKLASAGGDKVAGDKIYVPAIQQCTGGVTSDWVALPGEEGKPAASLTYVEPFTIETVEEHVDILDARIQALEQQMNNAAVERADMHDRVIVAETSITTLQNVEHDDHHDEHTEVEADSKDDTARAVAIGGLVAGIVAAVIALVALVVAARKPAAAATPPGSEYINGGSKA